MSLMKRLVKFLVHKNNYSIDDLFLTGKEMPYTASGKSSPTVQRSYVNSQAAYACITRIAKDISSVPMTFWSSKDAATATETPDHPIAKLFEKPSPGYTREQLMQLFVIYLLMRGDATLVTDRLRDPQRIYSHFDPLHWKAVIGDGPLGKDLAGYQYKHGTDNEILRTPDDMVFHRLISPYKRWRGQSPLEAAASQVAITQLGPSLQASTLARGGEKGIIFKHPSFLSDPQYDQLLARLKARKRGPGQAPENVILEGGTDIVDPRFTASDMKILDILPPSKEDICQVFGMSDAIIGAQNISNNATFKSYLKIYWQQTVLPLIRGITEALDTWSASYGVYVRFDLSKVDALQDYLDDKTRPAKTFYGMGVSMAELNRRLDLGFDIKGIVSPDVPLTNMSMVPFDQAAEGKSYENRAAQVADPADKAADFNGAVVRAAQPDMAIPLQRRLAKIGTSAKSDARSVMLEMMNSDGKSGALHQVLAKAVEEARRQGAASAVMAVGDGTLDEAIAASKVPTIAELTQTAQCATEYLDRLTAGIDHGSRQSYQKALNLISPVVTDLVAEAAAAGFNGKLAGMGFLPTEE